MCPNWSIFWLGTVDMFRGEGEMVGLVRPSRLRGKCESVRRSCAEVRRMVNN
jgi:hypothetical protein